MMDDCLATLIRFMIYIDASRYSNTEKRTGVENYSYYLINELAKLHPQEIALISPRKIGLPVRQIIIPFPRLWTHLRLSWEIWRRKEIDNLFVPSHVLPLVCPEHSVITIHDVAFKHFPESYSPASRCYLNWATGFAAKRAEKIITPSESTREDLVRFYGADPKKISVIPLGFSAPKIKADSKSTEALFKKYRLKPHEYFLYVGRLEHKKNTDTLVKAFAEYAKGNVNCKLVLAGALGYGGQAIVDSIPAILKDRVICPGYVAEAEKYILMTHSLCFVFPSRFEGFGLPLLEALSLGVPVLASDIPSSREVAGEAAYYFDVNSPEALEKAMKKLSSDPELRRHLIIKGRQRAKNYSWNKCAQSVFALLENKSLLDQRQRVE